MFLPPSLKIHLPKDKYIWKAGFVLRSLRLLGSVLEVIAWGESPGQQLPTGPAFPFSLPPPPPHQALVLFHQGLCPFRHGHTSLCA